MLNLGQKRDRETAFRRLSALAPAGSSVDRTDHKREITITIVTPSGLGVMVFLDTLCAPTAHWFIRGIQGAKFRDDVVDIAVSQINPYHHAKATVSRDTIEQLIEHIEVVLAADAKGMVLQ